MYTIEQVSSRHELADIPLHMPVDYILVVPAYIARDQHARDFFNLPGAITELPGLSDYEYSNRIMRSSFCLPGWDQGMIANLTHNSEWTSLPDSITSQFPGTTIVQDYDTMHPITFEIVHFRGRIGQLEDGQASLFLDKNEQLAEETLASALRTAGTRLLILETDPFGFDFSYGVALGRRLVEQGGPIALIVTSQSRSSLDAFFGELLDDLIHNRLFSPPLDYKPRWEDQNHLFFWLITGKESSRLFNFDFYRKSLEEKLSNAKGSIDEIQKVYEEIFEKKSAFLHRAQEVIIDERWLPEYGKVAMAPRSFQPVDALHSIELIGDKLEMASRPWDHESEGAIPTSEADMWLAYLDEDIDDMATVTKFALEHVENEILRAPRVLNANFKNPRTNEILASNVALGSGQEYELLVDIGPLWNQATSIVSGGNKFPEFALPPDEKGHLIQVLVVSDDFSPSIVSGELWLPSGTGRSFPILDGEIAEKSGPLSIALQAPEFPKGSRKRLLRVEARLCLYYENNLLQSAVIAAGVTRKGDSKLRRPNSIVVDYALSGAFQTLEEQFATRALQIGTTGMLPVKLNLAMNQNGRNGHRFVVKGRLDQAASIPQSTSCLPHAWISYDPKSGEAALNNARRKLQECYYKRDIRDGKIERKGGKPVYGLNENKGKNRDEFKRDLFELARFGATLFSEAFSQPQMEGDDCNPVEWQRNLLSILKNTSVIQVAHTGNAQYVYPWSLVYEYPLIQAESKDWKICKIVNEEWKHTGVRTRSGEERTVCKYHDEDFHQKNIICPYGFWGLKHVIEEPMSIHQKKGADRLANQSNSTRISDAIRLSIALTEDKELDRSKINSHIQLLMQMDANIIPSKPARDWDGVKDMLRDPEVVYFLCHGEYDDVRNDEFLSIGPRDQKDEHRIYNKKTLAPWTLDMQDGPNVAAWKQFGPLVFINGCHTADLVPGKVVSFANTFAKLGANGILGTEISVDLPVAIEFAESMFQKIGPHGNYMSLGKALRQARWELANKGNLVGLAYTLYGMADLRLLRAGI